ncbi:MAG: bifunctional hydroxymethylpyrimidine kinase/phosphomethylpyrimidine kinase [Actinomycetaceae bacterium]|nr:bifunctional hydroxymethylpyrimidine kinase/phosphomethylpyrimidine kinase [Actinomycetaceae bacterium]
MVARVLTIAGTDPTGGAGSQADVKSITVTGGFAYAVTTAVLAQNTQGVRDIWMLQPEALQAQLAAVADDCEIDAIKIGMLASVEFIEIVGKFLQTQDCPVVLDPVMVATSGDRLIDEDALEALRAVLPLASVITPNTPELEIIADLEPGSVKTFSRACEVAREVAARYHTQVVVKGGHLSEKTMPNALVDASGVVVELQSPRIDTKNTHGTGCSFSSALATRLGLGESAPRALAWTVRWMEDAIGAADSLHVGQGHGPIHHGAQILAMQERARNLVWQWAAAAERFQQITTQGSANLQGRDSDPVLTAHLKPAGPWTAALWELAKPVMEQIWQLPFIVGLREGTLPLADFVAYQKQDAWYLERHSQACGFLAGKASAPAETRHWSEVAALCLTAESDLHKESLAQVESRPEEWIATMPPTAITAGYGDYLVAQTAGSDYLEGVCAILPCAWLYAEIGLQLVKHNRPDHPYHGWLSLYADEVFLEAARTDIAIAERLLEQASPSQRERAARAFVAASEWEREFFDQASRLDLRP